MVQKGYEGMRWSEVLSNIGDPAAATLGAATHQMKRTETAQQDAGTITAPPVQPAEQGGRALEVPMLGVMARGVVGRGDGKNKLKGLV